MAENKLPENWRETIAECDFALANEVLSDVFLFNERKAASEGKQAAYPSEYLQGWEAFAMHPRIRRRFASSREHRKADQHSTHSS
jgi:hypothetical protein